MQLDEPTECASRGDPLLLYKVLHLLFFPLVRMLCKLRLESRGGDYQHDFDAGLWNFSFFGQGDVSSTHSELCRFVSGSKAKLQVSSPVINLFKKFLSASAIAIMLWQDVTRSSLCSGGKDCRTKRAHNFLFPKSSFRIRRTTVLGMFKDSALIRDAIWRSFLTKWATAALLMSVGVDFGWPPLSSSSTTSLPSRNRECYLKTFDQFRASFPQAFCTKH